MILDLIALGDNAKVWIYQSDREFSDDQLILARKMIHDFLIQWTAHQQELHCYGNIFHRRFLGLFVDENARAYASGCSIDASVKWVEHLGQVLGCDFFDRMTYYYMDEDERIKKVHHSDMPDYYAQGIIDDQTLFFDNLVKTKKDFLDHWLVPLKDSWHQRFVH